MKNKDEQEKNSVTYWLDEIQDAKKREKDYRDDGKKVIDIYTGKKSAPFNILYSNTETLLPALFSQLPRPVIERRFKDDDPVGRHAAIAAQRMMEYLLDTDIEEYDSFDEAMTAATLDGLLPGRGITAVRYDAVVEEEAVKTETVCTDAQKWDRVHYGFATKWSKVPWIAYELYLTRQECEKLFEEKANSLKYSSSEEEKDEKEGDTAQVYQIWDKAQRKIRYLTEQNKDMFLRVDDDPLGLTGFFNCPKPIQFIRPPSNTLPVSLYSLYKNQAEELNNIQRRLNRIIEAIKVRGVYDGNLGDEIEQLLKQDDNALLKASNASVLTEGGFDKNIWFLPIEKLIIVAQQLYQAREACKHVIYEITGISDIVRGQSAASETLGAQKIKEAWGTMRLKRLQKEVQRYALDTIKIMLEVVITRFSVESWAKMTQLPYPTMEKKQQAQQALAASQMEYKKRTLLMQQMGQPPPPPFMPDPSLAQITQSPAWEDILDVLKDDFSRSYRLDIETNSTLDVEATEDKQQTAEFMNAMSQFMNGVMPMVREGAMPFEAAKSMMLAVVKRYRFGRDVEEQLKSMKPPQPPVDPKMQQEMQKFQDEKKQLEQEKMKLAVEKQKLAQEMDLKNAQLDFEKKMAQMEQKYKEDLAMAKIKITQDKMQTELEGLFSKQENKLQRIFDKQSARLDKHAAIRNEM